VERGRHRLGAAVVASLALHAASVGMAPPPPAGPPEEKPSEPIEVEFEPVAQAPPEGPRAEVPPRQREGRPAPPAPLPMPVESVAPPAVEEPIGQVSRPSGPPVAVDLSPLAAARSLVDVRAAPDASCAPREERDAGMPDDALEASLAQDITGLSRAGEEPLGPRIKRAYDGVLAPWSALDPRLPDGRYRYNGRGFDAVILEDGSVDIRDKNGVKLMVGVPYRSLKQPEIPQILLGTGVSVTTDQLGGNRADSVEHRDFMARTRGLREHLHEKAMARVRARADRELVRALARLWGGDEPLSARKAKLFALWDDCADDEVGELRRAQIESFVREQCPPGNDCAFTTGELAMLNQGRISKRAFAPYELRPLADAGVN
jgi:hypothetical protein